jgi:hypothetical protein
MNVRYRVTLTQYERDELEMLLRGASTRHGGSSGRDAGVSDEDSAMSIGVGGSTVYGPRGVSWKATWTSP